MRSSEGSGRRRLRHARSLGAVAGVLVVFGMVTTTLGQAKPPMAGKSDTAAGAARQKSADWMDNFLTAQKKAQKEEKPMLLYFCSTDRDDFTKKLEEEVINTPFWVDWANQNLILVRVDFVLDTKRQPANIRAQAGDLKSRFNIAKVPTFIFLDPWGELLGRCGYDTAALRDDEPKGQPKKWLEYCQTVLASRPTKEKLVEQPDLESAVTSAKKTAIPVCILIHQTANNQVAARQKETLITNQLFVRWINRNMGFVQAAWPENVDQSPKAKYLRDFAAKWKFGPSPLQLIIWDPGGLGQNKAMIPVSFDPTDCGPLIKRLEPLLPAIDYGGGWLDNWKVAQALAVQQQKDLLISFVSSDGSEFSKKMEDEIYSQPEFKNYAKNNLILLKIDFPFSPDLQAKQSKDLKEQNNMLADMFGVRGYPTVVVRNPKGQKILDGKYMKGGAPVFVQELKLAVQKDKDRRTLLSQELSKDAAP